MAIITVDMLTDLTTAILLNSANRTPTLHERQYVQSQKMNPEWSKKIMTILRPSFGRGMTRTATQHCPIRYKTTLTTGL